MAKAIICDRCGKKGLRDITRLVGNPYSDMVSINTDKCVISADLCEKCIEDLFDFINNKELDDTEQYTLYVRVDENGIPHCMNLIDKKYCKTKSCNTLD